MAAGKGASTASRIGAGRAVLAGVSKASAVVTVGASVFHVSAWSYCAIQCAREEKCEDK